MANLHLMDHDYILPGTNKELIFLSEAFFLTHIVHQSKFYHFIFIFQWFKYSSIASSTNGY